jgi:Transposase IS66 family/Transcriptional regulatory protein, C terminal
LRTVEQHWPRDWLGLSLALQVELSKKKTESGGYATDGSAISGPYQLLAAQRLLLEGDKPVRLGGRAFDVLTALVERAGEVVSKEELIARAWPKTFVEEANLKLQVSTLRRALGDGQGDNRYHGRGHIHANALLGGYRGILQCDGYSAYKKFGGSKSADPAVTLAFCWSHVRRGFYDLAKAKAPIAIEALKRLAAKATR